LSYSTRLGISQHSAFDDDGDGGDDDDAGDASGDGDDVFDGVDCHLQRLDTALDASSACVEVGCSVGDSWRGTDTSFESCRRLLVFELTVVDLSPPQPPFRRPSLLGSVYSMRLL
jgi:hypothetical protein